MCKCANVQMVAFVRSIINTLNYSHICTFAHLHIKKNTVARRRINLSVPPELFKELERIRKRYRFSTTCKMCVVLLRVYARMVAEAEAAPPTDPDTDADYIAATFERMSDAMATPSNTPPTVRHPRRRIE